MREVYFVICMKIIFYYGLDFCDFIFKYSATFMLASFVLLIY